MVRFIVPLQSPHVSDDWKRVSDLCNLTLKSITSQTNSNFEVALVCNELPQSFESHPRIKVLISDLPPPRERGKARMEDKWKKVRLGLSHYRNSTDAFYMIVDADDRISNQLVEFVLRVDYTPGWYVDRGLIYDWGFPWVYKKKRFDLICGTSSIIFCPSDLLPLGAGDRAEKCCLTNYGHTIIKSYFDRQARPLKPLPFYGCVYMLNTGQNDSESFYLGINSRLEKMKRILSIRPITKKIRHQFFLWDI